MKKLGFGCMRLPLKDENDPKSIDIEQVCKMFDTFLERGFTYFDTAYPYHGGESEAAVREALVKRHPRETFTLATKMPLFALKAASEQEGYFNGQLEKCGVDYFDYYLLHNINAQNYEKLNNEFDSFGFISEKKKAGKIKNIGFSFHDNADLLDKILTDHPEVDFVQLQINYLDWDDEGVQSGKCYKVAEKHKVPVVVMEPVKGGILARIPEEAEKLLKEHLPEASIPSWAIRFVAGKPNVMVVLSGMSNIAQVEDNTGYMQNFSALSSEEESLVKKVAEIINSANAIPCTACRYCVDGCPQNILIPNYFALYNAQTRKLSSGKRPPSSGIYYKNYITTYGKASDCVECGQCEDSCPQHINIIERLKEVAAEFEK